MIFGLLITCQYKIKNQDILNNNKYCPYHLGGGKTCGLKFWYEWLNFLHIFLKNLTTYLKLIFIICSKHLNLPVKILMTYIIDERVLEKYQKKILLRKEKNTIKYIFK